MLVALLTTAALAVAQPGGDEIIKKSIDAQGGAEKIKAIKTLRMTGNAVIGGKVEAQMVYRAKRPLRFPYCYRPVGDRQILPWFTGPQW